MWAAGQGHVQATQTLIELGANKDLKDDRAMTALDIAISNHHVDIVEILKK
jgi:ankyrin repeat protein